MRWRWRAAAAGAASVTAVRRRPRPRGPRRRRMGGQVPVGSARRAVVRRGSGLSSSWSMARVRTCALSCASWARRWLRRGCGDGCRPAAVAVAVRPGPQGAGRPPRRALRCWCLGSVGRGAGQGGGGGVEPARGWGAAGMVAAQSAVSCCVSGCWRAVAGVVGTSGWCVHVGLLVGVVVFGLLVCGGLRFLPKPSGGMRCGRKSRRRRNCVAAR